MEGLWDTHEYKTKSSSTMHAALASWLNHDVGDLPLHELSHVSWKHSTMHRQDNVSTVPARAGQETHLHAVMTASACRRKRAQLPPVEIHAGQVTPSSRSLLEGVVVTAPASLDDHSNDLVVG